MHTQYLIINDSSKREVVKDISTVLPDIKTSILPETLIIEPINLSDLSRLMISPDQKELTFVPDLKDQQQ